MFEYFILPYFICMHSYPALFLKQFLPQGWFRLSSVLGHVVVVCKQMRLTLHRRKEYRCIYTNSMLGQVVPDCLLVSINCWITTLIIVCTVNHGLIIAINGLIHMHASSCTHSLTRWKEALLNSFSSVWCHFIRRIGWDRCCLGVLNRVIVI